MIAVVVLCLSYGLYGALVWWPGDRAMALALLLTFQSALWLWVWHRRLFSRWLLLSAVVAMVLARGTSPLFEDDYFRYYWDGWQARTTGDPYALPPKEDRPTPETVGVQAWINFPELRTFYPPVTQRVFSLLVGWGLEPFLWGLALIPWLGIYFLGRGQAQWVWLLQHPLLIREWFQAAHFDGWFAWALLGMGVATQPWSRGFWLGAGTGIKAVSLGLVPVLKEPLRARYFWGVLVGLGVGGGLWWDFAQSLSTWKAFSTQWEMNSGVFRWIRNALSDGGMGWETANGWARVGVGAAWVVALVFIRRERDRSVRLFWAAYLLVLLSPVVNPWYVTWVLPLAGFLPRRQQLPVFLSWTLLGLAYVFYRPSFDSVELWWTVEHIGLWAGVIGALAGTHLIERYHRLRRSGSIFKKR